MRHIDFAAHFQKFGCGGNLFGDRLDGGKVFGHVLPHQAIAAGGAAGQAAVAVFQADRKAVDFDFYHIFRRNACFPHALVKLAQFIQRESVLQAFHFNSVGHLAELAAGGAAHMLGGAVRRDKLRELGFDGFQLAGQLVILVIFQFRGVLVIIQTVILFNHSAQFCCTFAGLLQFHGSISSVCAVIRLALPSLVCFFNAL